MVEWSGEDRLMRTLQELINNGGLMRNESGNEQPVSMSDLVMAGVLVLDGADEEGVFFEIDWDKLKEYSEELYLYFREAEMMGELVPGDDTMEA
jgi:hypothetical protein